MSETLTINAKPRDISRKSIGKDLKKAGNVLSILYGRGKEYPLSINRREFEVVYKKAGKHSIVNLNIDGEGVKEVLVKTYTIDGIKRTVDHVDFYEIDRKQKIKTTIPINIIGTPEGVRIGGGTMQQIAHNLSIRTFPDSIPHQIDIDVTELQAGASIHLSDVKFGEGVSPIGDSGKPILTVIAPEEEAAK